MEVASGTIRKMEENIRDKLLAVGAVSRDKAVTKKDARFDMQELNWIDYVAGGLFAEVKKTADRRYYVTVSE